MIPDFTQAKVAVLCICILSLAPHGRSQDSVSTPDPSAILRAARLNNVTQDTSLSARLRTDKNKKIPFQIVLREGIVRYQFTDPDQEIRLELNEKQSKLSELINGKPVPISRVDTRIRGTTITYEDLSLQFLYWPNPKLLGEDVIRTRAAWKLEIQSPKAGSAYGAARLWIDKVSGAVLRIDGYTDKGLPAKRFEVISAQKIDGQWMLRTMRVEAYAADGVEVIDRTYLEVMKGS